MPLARSAILGIEDYRRSGALAVKAASQKHDPRRRNSPLVEAKGGRVWWRASKTNLDSVESVLVGQEVMAI
jgi:hypothetical protein